MNKLLLLLLGFGAFHLYSLQDSRGGTEKVNSKLIYGRWATFDEKLWWEFRHNGICNGQIEGREFVGSYRQTGQGEFEVTRARGKREKVYMRGGRLVCFSGHVEFRLRKKKDFIPGTLQSVN